MLISWWVFLGCLETSAEQVRTLDLDADEPEQQLSEAAQKSELESAQEMASEFWEQLPPEVKQTAIWDYGYDGVVGARWFKQQLVSSKGREAVSHTLWLRCRLLD